MHRDIVVMGASAGGVEALSAAVAGLPRDLDAAVFVVLHLPPTAASVLPAVLQRQTALPVASAVSGEPIRTGHIYVAPPDHHLLLRPELVYLSRGAKENRHRPAVDPLFRSAARHFGPRVIGVILSGTLDDGALGLRIVAAGGGAAAVQDPADAPFPGMPESALGCVADAIVAPARELGEIIGELSRSPVQVEGMVAMADNASFDVDNGSPDAMRGEHPGRPSVFTCPECHGTIFVTDEGEFSHFRCRVGHAFSAESLLAGESEALEAALWTALRSLEERNELLRRMAERARGQGQLRATERFDDQAKDGDRNAGLLRQMLQSGETARDRPA